MKTTTRLLSYYRYSVIGLLLVLGISKMLAMNVIPDTDDPIVPVSTATLVFLAGIIEIALGVALLLDRRGEWFFPALLSFAATLLIYRIGVWWVGAPQECGCLGKLGYFAKLAFGVSTVGYITLGALAYFSVGPLIWLVGSNVGRLRIFRFYFFLVICLVSQHGSVQAETVYKLSGVLSAEWYEPSGQVITNQDISFAISLAGSGREWSIRSNFNAQSNWFYEAYCDGTNTFVAGSDPRTPPSTPLTGTVYPGVYPYFGSAPITIPWLAYCSAAFLVSSADDVVLPNPMFSATMDPQAYVCRTEVDWLSAHGPSLPSQVSFLTDSNRIESAIRSVHLRVGGSGDELIRKSKMDYGYLYSPGLELLRYEVVDRISIGSLVVPNHFRLVKNQRTGYVDTGVKTYIHARIDGRLVESSVVEVEHFEQPAYARPIAVFDYRAQDQTENIVAMNYIIPDGIWVQGGGKLQALIDAHRSKARSIQRIEFLKKWAVLAILFLPLVGLIFFWVLRLRQNKTKLTHNAL